MASLGQELAAGFDQHSHCARRHKGQGSDPYVMKQECTFCNVLTTDQKAQLATPSYKLKKDKKADKKDSGNYSSSLIDPDHVSVLGGCERESPEKVVKEKQNTRNPLPSSPLLKALNAKWSDRFSQIEVMLVAKILEKPAEMTFQTVK